MSLLQRSLDPEKTLGLVDVLYTTVFDLNRWKERKAVAFLSSVTAALPSLGLFLLYHSKFCSLQV